MKRSPAKRLLATFAFLGLLAAFVTATGLPPSGSALDYAIELAEGAWAERAGDELVVVAVDASGRPEITSIDGVRSQPELLDEVLAIAAEARIDSVGWGRDMRVADLVDEDLTFNQWALPRLQAETVWAKNTGGAVTVAVVDTGVAPHPDFSRLLPGVTITNGVITAGANDTNGHGTHVAGIIAANRNGKGTTGLAPEVAILPVNVMPGGGGSSSDVALGIVWAVDNGAQVINLSLGAQGGVDAAVGAALGYAADHDIVVVAASGNCGTCQSDTDPTNDITDFYPASDPRVIAVGSIDQDGVLSRFSNAGDWLDLVAPGRSIYAPTVGGPLMRGEPAGTYTFAALSGTSMATPHVAAAAAIIRSRHPELSASSVHQILSGAARDLGLQGRDPYYGDGELDVVAAIGVADVASSNSPQNTPTDVTTTTTTTTTSTTTTTTQPPVTTSTTLAPPTVPPTAAPTTTTPSSVATTIPGVSVPPTSLPLPEVALTASVQNADVVLTLPRRVPLGDQVVVTRDGRRIYAGAAGTFVDNGRALVAGTYLYEVRSADFTATATSVVVRIRPPSTPRVQLVARTASVLRVRVSAPKAQPGTLLVYRNGRLLRRVTANARLLVLPRVAGLSVRLQTAEGTSRAVRLPGSP